MTPRLNWAGAILLAILMILSPTGLLAQTSDSSPDQPTQTAPAEEKSQNPQTTDKAPESEPTETRAALVNDTIITREQLETEVNAATQRMAKGGQPVPGEQLDALREKALDSIIDRELLYQESVKQKISADQAQVDKRYAALKQRFGDEAKYEESIKAMGLTDSGIQEMITRSLVIETLIETQVTANIEVKEEEKKAFYEENPSFFKQPEQVQARHILIKMDENADEQTQQEARKAIEMVQEKVKAGEDFTELAKTHSQGPSNTKGGDLGFFGKGQMVKPFEDAAFAMQPGEVSDIVQTRFGYHLIKVTDRREASVQPYEEASEKIDQYLNQQKSKQAFDTFMEGLKKDAKIEKFI
ncbi:MAG: peptidylprolyl isomerase [Desulfobacterales bacterium]